ncbi:MAG: tyrosine-type recombinase/integrase [Actinobacteria bacterium]|nr:tyrosine-type recombinase/integrase [Actinomycetota bacterium]
MITLLALNGLRISEALNADIADLSTERGHRTLAIVRKGGKHVTIPLAPRTGRALDLYIGERTMGPIFLGLEGGRMDRYCADRMVKRLVKRAGIDKRISPHSLRHSDTQEPTDRACRAFRIVLPDGRAYWTVVDDGYRKVAVADRFLFDHRFGRDRAESTSRVYAGELASFLSWCSRGGRTLEDGARDLSRFVLFLRTTPTTRAGAGQGRPPGADRINHVLAVVREFFKHAVAARAVQGDVLVALYEIADDRHLPAELRDETGALRYRAQPRHRLRTSRPARPDAVSQQEWEALLGAASSWRDRFLLVLLWFTGLRISEALGLRRSDLHLMASSTSVGCQMPGPHLHVIRRDNPNGSWAKSRHSRAVPVGRWVLDYYDRYLAERLACPAADGCDFVLVNLFHVPLGAPMTASTVRQLFGTLGRRAGLARAVRPHMLRHSTGTELAEAGVAIDVVQQLLGHRSITSTQVYVHPSPGRMRDAVERLEASSRQRAHQEQGDER